MYEGFKRLLRPPSFFWSKENISPNILEPPDKKKMSKLENLRNVNNILSDLGLDTNIVTEDVNSSLLLGQIENGMT